MKKKTINFLKAGIIILLLAVIAMGVTIYAKQEELTRTTENNYNMAFYELVDYVKNVETYLAKAQISTTPEHSAETLTNLWREANLAQSYLTMLPIESQELENIQGMISKKPGGEPPSHNDE